MESAISQAVGGGAKAGAKRSSSLFYRLFRERNAALKAAEAQFARRDFEGCLESCVAGAMESAQAKNWGSAAKFHLLASVSLRKSDAKRIAELLLKGEKAGASGMQHFHNSANISAAYILSAESVSALLPLRDDYSLAIRELGKRRFFPRVKLLCDSVSRTKGLFDRLMQRHIIPLPPVDLLAVADGLVKRAKDLPKWGNGEVFKEELGKAVGALREATNRMLEIYFSIEKVSALCVEKLAFECAGILLARASEHSKKGSHFDAIRCCELAIRLSEESGARFSASSAHFGCIKALQSQIEALKKEDAKMPVDDLEFRICFHRAHAARFRPKPDGNA